jgi:hypothetical protein
MPAIMNELNLFRMKSNLRDIYVNATPIILYIKFNQYTTTNHHTKININPIV